MIGYYRMDGTPYNDVLEWAEDSERMSKDGTQVIGDTRIWPYRISTVWLGLDYQYGNGPPLIFETMVFRRATWRTWWQCWWGQWRFRRPDALSQMVKALGQMVERFRPRWSRLLRMLQK